MTTALDAFKIHLNVTDDEDDALLTQKLSVASAWVESITGKPVDDAAPATVHEAARMLAGHLVENREATIAGVTLQEIPFGVMQLLDAHRYWPGQAA